MIFNELAVRVTSDPISSFFSMPKDERYTPSYRKTPNNDDIPDLKERLKRLSKLYFKRGNHPVESHYYAINRKCIGMTPRVVEVTNIQSNKLQADISKFQEKFVNDHVSQILKQAILRPNLISITCSPENNRLINQAFMEKPILLHNIFVRRLYTLI